MWNEVLGKGKVKYTERYKDPRTGKYRYVSITLESDKPQAQRQALKILNNKIEEKLSETDKDKITLGYVIDKYLEYHKESVTFGTYKRDKGTIDALGRILGRDSFVNQLTTRYVIDSLTKTKKKGVTLNGYRQRLLSMFRWAYNAAHMDRIELMDRFPKFKEETTKKERIQDKFLEEAEMKKLIEEMGHEEWNLVTRILCLSGMRIGEFIALNKEDVDTKNRYIYIRKTYNPVHGGLKDHPKTDDSVRDIYIQDELLDAVKDVNRYVNEKKMLLGLRQCAIFFPNDKGNYIHYDSYRQYLADTSIRVLGRKITPHALRHTHTSLMAGAGVQLEIITRRLGHASSDITRDIYFHITEKLKDRDNEALKNIKIM